PVPASIPSEGHFPARRSRGTAAPESSMRPFRVAGTAAGLAAGGVAWGHFEAGWVRLRTLAVPVPELPRELEGLRIAHLSDFHLGVPSRGEHAVEPAVAWVEERRPDLVALTGDLLSRRN